MGGCCGEPADKADDNEKQQLEKSLPFPPQQTIATQPSPVPQPSPFVQPLPYQLPSLSTPPPTHLPNAYQATQTPWSHSPSPSIQSPNAYNYSPPPGAALPQVPNGSYFSSYQSAPLTTPSPTHQGGFTPESQMRHSIMTTSHQAGFQPANVAPDEGKMSVSIDFGTTFSGVAYGSSRLAGGAVQQILHWPGTPETFRKIPTCLLYDKSGQLLAWGLEAKNANEMPDVIKCEWFKLYLEPETLRDSGSADPRLPALPPGKTAYDLVVDFLSCLWEYAKNQITKDIGAVADLNSADVWLTVPAAWDARGCEMMREAAITAGLVQSARAGEQNWRDRLRIITEPEAAAVHCAHLTTLHKLKPSQTFMIVDAGGGTVDLAVYKIMGEMQHLEIAEMCARSGRSCGSIFLDLRFRELVTTLLADHPAHLDAASLANFMHSFQEVDKLAYEGAEDDDTMFNFTCFNPEDPEDPTVGLMNGELCIPGNLLRREVFDPVVNQVLELIEEQAKRINRDVNAILLVGGFSQSNYLLTRVKEQLGNRIRTIARPADADTATLRGAARYGLARRPLVSSVIAPRSYILKVKLPAEREDWQQRPVYISNNANGVPICDNRLSYLVTKGAILRKGQRLLTPFCKYSANSQDAHFTATLFTSDSDKTYRYTDEGETRELCQWQVDLRPLPSWQQKAASTPPGQGFYTEFELGLELDSVEVRGILMWEGKEWGRVVFDFLN